MLKVKNPTSPGRRAQVNIVKEHTSKSPVKSLTRSLKGPRGRSKGKVSMRHQSRGAKKHYRLVDFKRDKFDVSATVKTVEYDPIRNANISLAFYTDGEKRYILAPKGIKVDDVIVSSEKGNPKLGNSMRLINIPLGMPIHNIELQPGKGGQMVRGAGTSATITAKEGDYVTVKMPSGEIRKILAQCFATIGEVGNEDFKNRKIGKAGRKRHMGIRPTVRGVSYSNPRDHSHGGSYRSTGIGLKRPVSPTGVPSKGFKTRKRKKTNFYKVKDRRRK